MKNHILYVHIVSYYDTYLIKCASFCKKVKTSYVLERTGSIDAFRFIHVYFHFLYVNYYEMSKYYCQLIYFCLKFQIIV